MGSVRRNKRLWAIALFCAAAGIVAAQPARIPPPDKVPEDFPKDIPLVPNSTIRDYMPAEHNRVRVGNILVLETPGTQEAVIEFYKKQLPTDGWKVLKHPKSEADVLEAVKEGRRAILGIVATRQGANPTTTYRVVAVHKH